MEAFAKHDFKPKQQDEIGFNRNDLLKIINVDDDKNWYKAEVDSQCGYVPSNYVEMKNYSWYISRITRSESEKILMDRDTKTNELIQPDGSFIVRSSESSPGGFSMSVKVGASVQHFKILRDSTNNFFLWVHKFNSINDLVEYHKKHSVSRTQTIYLVDMKRIVVRADYDFKAQEADELELKTGLYVTVVENRDKDWWTGEYEHKGKYHRGIFPRSYVTIVNSY
ncbi:GRB2-related adapter protein [Intoshia linei]|uniref:GRB2-related adapter protein n=1 Tax=Intoshia linei TaxID=1819745 RepID=A0A177AWG9_9BILA|nr:GRB2-related adapter protein [Intoshia linei]